MSVLNFRVTGRTGARNGGTGRWVVLQNGWYFKVIEVGGFMRGCGISILVCGGVWRGGDLRLTVRAGTGVFGLGGGVICEVFAVRWCCMWRVKVVCWRRD